MTGSFPLWFPQTCGKKAQTYIPGCRTNSLKVLIRHSGFSVSRWWSSARIPTQFPLLTSSDLFQSTFYEYFGPQNYRSSFDPISHLDCKLLPDRTVIYCFVCKTVWGYFEFNSLILIYKVTSSSAPRLRKEAFFACRCSFSDNGTGCQMQSEQGHPSFSASISWNHSEINTSDFTLEKKKGLNFMPRVCNVILFLALCCGWEPPLVAMIYKCT